MKRWRLNLKDFDKLIRKLSTSPQKSKNKIPRASQNREAGLWRLISDALKQGDRKIEAARIESWAVPGVPDVVLCSEDGQFSFLELKAAKAHGPLSLSPHQVSWLTRHGHSKNCFVVLWAPVLLDNSHTHHTYFSTRMGLHLYPGSDATELRMDGTSKVAATAIFEGPAYDWESFFALTCPL